MEELYEIRVTSKRFDEVDSMQNRILEFHECSEDELGIADSVNSDIDSKFSKPFPDDYLAAIKSIPTRLICLDNKDLYLQGKSDAIFQTNLSF